MENQKGEVEETTEIDQRVDSYALACLAFEMLAGERPFHKDTKFGVFQQKLAFRLPPRESIGFGVSEEMHAFLRDNLEVGRDRRSLSLAEQAAWSGPIDVKALCAES